MKKIFVYLFMILFSSQSFAMPVNGNLNVENGGNFQAYSDALTTRKFRIDGSTGNAGAISGAKFCFDGTDFTTCNDYIQNSANGQNDLYANGILAMRTVSNGNVTFPNSISVGAGNRVLLNGIGGDSYIIESSPGIFDLVVSGDGLLSLNAGLNAVYVNSLNLLFGINNSGFQPSGANGLTIFTSDSQLVFGNTRVQTNGGTSLGVETQNDLFLDGGGDTYFKETSANVPIGVAGGKEYFRGKSTGEIKFPQVDPPTANYANGNSFVKGWAVIQSNGSVSSSYNVSTVTRNSAGNYTINWDTDFSSGNYSVVASAQGNESLGTYYIAQVQFTGTTSTIINTINLSTTLAADRAFFIQAIGTQ